jgi:septal ring factor EnvC (AmiA/AmiB activator)
VFFKALSLRAFLFCIKEVFPLEQKDYERIATLETQLAALSKSLERIESKLDQWTANFLPRNEAELRFGQMGTRLNQIETRLDKQEKNKKDTISLLVSAAAVVVTFIFSLLNYLKG